MTMRSALPMRDDGSVGAIAKRRIAAPEPGSRPTKIPAKIYGIMTVTTLLTFATLTTSYQLLFSHHPFA